jgi:hypothetical protein
LQTQINKEFVPSTSGAAAAGAVAGVPGLGLLLAAAAGGIGGAVDAGVNASRAKKAEEEIKPLRAALADYNFDQALKAAVDNKLQALTWLQAQPSEVAKDPKIKTDEPSSEAPQLYLVASYSVAPDFGALHVKVQAQQFAKVAATPVSNQKHATTSRKAKAKPIYKNAVTFTAKLPTSSSSSDTQRLDSWRAADTQTRAVRVRNALDRAANEIAATLASDMEMDQDSVKKQLANKELADYREQPKGMVLGKIVAKVDNQTVVRHRDGSLDVILQL